MRAEFGFRRVWGTVLLRGAEAGLRGRDDILVPRPATCGGLGSCSGDDGGRGGGTSAEATAACRGPRSRASLLPGLRQGRRCGGTMWLGAVAGFGLSGPVRAGYPKRTRAPGVAVLALRQAGGFRGHAQGGGAAFGPRHPTWHLSACEPGDGQRLALFAPEGRRGGPCVRSGQGKPSCS